MANISDAIIELRHVVKAFDGTCALDGISLTIGNGEFVTLLGPSGCGKTTLLRILSGFEAPDSGEVFIGGTSMAGVPPERRQVNTVFQSYALFPHMTVAQNVAFGLKMQKVPGAEIRRRVAEVLQMVHLTGFGDRRPSQLSGGQQQRVALARAVVNKPLVLLLDEPFSALDYTLRRHMQIEVKRLQRRLGITFVFVTHDQEEAFAMSDRIVVMNRGRIEQVGTPQEIYEEPGNLYVAGFVGEINMLDAQITAVKADGVYEVLAEGVTFPVRTKKVFSVGDTVHVLLRPEDIRITNANTASGAPCLHGQIVDAVYKGATVNISIAMDNGRRFSAVKFFNEDDQESHDTTGERVAVAWVDGRELVLPHDAG